MIHVFALVGADIPDKTPQAFLYMLVKSRKLYHCGKCLVLWTAMVTELV